MFKKIQKIDDKVFDSIVKCHRPLLNKIFSVFTTLGNGGVIWFLISIPFFFFPSTRIVGVNMVIGLSLTHVMGEIFIKHIVCRERPCHKLDDEQQIINRPKYYSFPSGHTASSFSMATTALLRCEWYIWLPILLLACTMAFSRMYLRVHYLSDIMGGMAVGVIGGTLSVKLVNYAYFHLTAKIMAGYTPPLEPISGTMPMTLEHFIAELVVWSIIAVVGVTLLIIFHFKKKRK